MSEADPGVEYDPLKFYDDPYPIYRLLRESAPVYNNEERDLWVLSRFDDVQNAGHDWHTFISGRGVDVDVEDFTLGPGDLLDMDPPRHDELRRILRETFTPRGIKKLEGWVEAKVAELLEPLLETGRGDFARDFAHRLPFGVICELWGIPEQDHRLIEDWFVRMVERNPEEMAVQDDVWIAGEEMRTYLDEAVNARIKKPRDDLLSVFANAISGGSMTKDEVTGMTRLLLVAGVHTTETLIANSLYLLAPLHDERRLLAEDPGLMPAAVEELLRFETPVQWLARATSSEVALHGRLIPAGKRVILLWASANRDDSRFSEPDHLDLKRSPNPHMAFGYGIHFCIGAPLARLESRIAFREVFRRIPEYHVSGPIQRMFTRQERGISSLPVEFSTKAAG
jgi:cytochrome P450